jgi:spore protease
MPLSSINDLESKPLNKEEITKLSGIIGSLDEDDRKRLMYEVLDKSQYNLMVTPKEIDFIIDKLSDLISICINESIHRFKL